jgi:hypothetical protein
LVQEDIRILPAVVEDIAERPRQVPSRPQGRPSPTPTHHCDENFHGVRHNTGLEHDDIHCDTGQDYHDTLQADTSLWTVLPML